MNDVTQKQIVVETVDNTSRDTILLFIKPDYFEYENDGENDGEYAISVDDSLVEFAEFGEYLTRKQAVLYPLSMRMLFINEVVRRNSKFSEEVDKYFSEDLDISSDFVEKLYSCYIHYDTNHNMGLEDTNLVEILKSDSNVFDMYIYKESARKLNSLHLAFEDSDKIGYFSNLKLVTQKPTCGFKYIFNEQKLIDYIKDTFKSVDIGFELATDVAIDRLNVIQEAFEYFKFDRSILETTFKPIADKALREHIKICSSNAILKHTPSYKQINITVEAIRKLATAHAESLTSDKLDELSLLLVENSELLKPFDGIDAIRSDVNRLREIIDTGLAVADGDILQRYRDLILTQLPTTKSYYTVMEMIV